MPRLVLDRIPELFGGNGHPLDETEYRQALREKLQDEVAEYLESGEVLELADILEVVYALAQLNGVSSAELERRRAAKAEERGGFERRLWWNGDALTPD